MRAGNGPTLVEADVYRYFHQNGPFPGSAFRYRTKEEEASWRARDPIDRTARHLVRRGILGQDEVDATIARAEELMAGIGDVLLEPKPGGKPRERQIKAHEWPDPAFVDHGRARRPQRASTGSPSPTPPTSRVAHRDEVHRRGRRRPGPSSGDRPARRHPRRGRPPAQRRHQRRDPRPQGRLPRPVLGTPDQRERLHRPRRRHGAGRPVPPGRRVHVRRLHVGRGRPAVQPDRQGAPHVRRRQRGAVRAAQQGRRWAPGYGSQHSMDPAGIFATAPGWRIVAPSTPFDYVGLMNTALACDDPVVVLEHVDLYASTGPAVDRQPRPLPPRRQGGRAPRAAPPSPSSPTGAMTPTTCCRRSRRPASTPTSIDLRWLDRASLDWDTISESIKKTNKSCSSPSRAPSARRTAAGSADEIQRRFFDWLDAPVERVTGGVASPSISKVLERAAFARSEEVVARLREIAEAGRARDPAHARGGRRRHRGDALGLERRGGAAYAAGDTARHRRDRQGGRRRRGGGRRRPAAPPRRARHTVEVGAPIAVSGAAGERPDDAALAALGIASATAADTPADAAPVAGRHAVGRRGGRTRGPRATRVFASPLARRVAREHGVDLAAVAGHRPGRPDPPSRRRGGAGGLANRPLLHRPSRRPSSRPEPPHPTARCPPRPPSAGYRRRAQHPSAQAIAARLTESKTTAPHFYVRGTPGSTGCSPCARRSTTAASQGLGQRPRRQGRRRAHTLVPALNVIWTGEAVRHFSRVDVAVAVATEAGW